MTGIHSEEHLGRVAAELHSMKGDDGSESLLALQRQIVGGQDPLGDAFCAIRSPEFRRGAGATYTPWPIIDSMLRWARNNASPARVVDPGAGSGRFALKAADVFPKASIVAIESDPLAVQILRANVAAVGLEDRIAVIEDDYRQTRLPKIDGQTLFIGNPPYVRHHNIAEEWKEWFARSAAVYGVKASKLAGLHLHFYLRTLQLARHGDVGAFITSSEWLDVNYGDFLRQLLSRDLGGVALHVLDPKALPFADATTTGAITCFKVGQKADKFRVRNVGSAAKLNGLSGGRGVSWEKLIGADRWSMIIRPSPRPPAGFVQLGEICRVHRGQVTGGNRVWVGGDAAPQVPERFLTPAVTRAKELISAGNDLVDARGLKRIIDLPQDLSELDAEERRMVMRFLRWAKQQGAHQSYIARHRPAWWSVGLKPPAPILCTYMARRPPAFVRNQCGARHINIAHGLYPRENLSNEALDAIAAFLRDNVCIHSGRTYAGGLTKFEPKELERIAIPPIEQLTA
ncbi:Eco57I restriction-modification methylase domain-containing protein [Spiribacter halobius]|uniref:site-specific DNA-methyltransferase (adenine-specific) n=1 Tax=Sediminicurvatus halobius TaxID=2182432 RepID=A0A2U2MY61_9GAMM|nr:methyltransferase [Spiribacter halobius]PWG61810.1 SAM-dependent methyltransferase [Spiribacter halobius]UEX77649.1 methyltransferase [Spiribacter halobius]